MLEPFRKLVSRRLPAALCLLAVAMQVSLPALHAPHSESVRPEVAASGGRPVLASAAGHAHDDARHHSESCSQCRLVSQLKSLTPLCILSHAPAVRAGWIAATPVLDRSSHAGRDDGAPRAPPFLA